MNTVTYPVFERLTKLLDQQAADYRVVVHPQAGRSEEVAKARGTEVGQGAKALVCELVGTTSRLTNLNSTRWILVILPADRKLDKSLLAELTGARKVRLADAEQATHLTGCVIGAIPPFSFNAELALVVDPQLCQRYSTIAFNAGRLDASILLNSSDYLRIAKPQLAAISGE